MVWSRGMTVRPSPTAGSRHVEHTRRPFKGPPIGTVLVGRPPRRPAWMSLPGRRNTGTQGAATCRRRARHPGSATKTSATPVTTRHDGRRPRCGRRSAANTGTHLRPVSGTNCAPVSGTHVYTRRASASWGVNGSGPVKWFDNSLWARGCPPAGGGRIQRPDGWQNLRDGSVPKLAGPLEINLGKRKVRPGS